MPPSHYQRVTFMKNFSEAFMGASTHHMLDAILKTLKDEFQTREAEMQSRHDAMAEALRTAAEEAGLSGSGLSEEIIGLALAGDFQHVHLRTPDAVGLRPEEFQALRALIYG